MKKWHLNDLENRCYLNIDDGKKIAMPRYYKDKLYTEEQRKVVAFYGKIRAEEQLLENFAAFGSAGEYWRSKFFSDKAENEKMYREAVKSRTKI